MSILLYVLIGYAVGMIATLIWALLRKSKLSIKERALGFGLLSFVWPLVIVWMLIARRRD